MNIPDNLLQAMGISQANYDDIEKQVKLAIAAGDTFEVMISKLRARYKMKRFGFAAGYIMATWIASIKATHDRSEAIKAMQAEKSLKENEVK